MKRMLFVVAVFMLCSLSARAVENSGNREVDFTKMKEIRIDGIQKRISILENSLKCLKAATDQKQMRTCNDKQRESMQAHRQDMKAKWGTEKPQK